MEDADSASEFLKYCDGHDVQYLLNVRLSTFLKMRCCMKMLAEGIPILLQAAIRNCVELRTLEHRRSVDPGSTQPQVGANETAVVATNGVNLAARPVFWIKRIQIPTDVCCTCAINIQRLA